MGLINRGILGGFSKKTGTVIGAYWRGLDVIKALPRNKGRKSTQTQLEQQQKFAVVTAFLSDFSQLIKIGFMSSELPATPMNKAVAYNLKTAVIGTSPDYAIDLPKFKFSVGKLAIPHPVTASALPGGKIRFEWDGNKDSEGGSSDPSDKVMILAYNAGKERFVKAIGPTTRETGEYELQLPASFNGDTLHLYISFTSSVKMLNSDSLYLGTAIATN